ncbi:unnamed protein product, partial [Rotaria magnacalcarata]
LAYCEEIGQTLIRQGNVSYIQLVDLQLFILMAEKSRAFTRNFQLDPMSYKEPTWLIELRRIIQNLIDNAFLNKTVRDDTINPSVQQIHKIENNAQQTTQSTYADRKPSTNSRQTEQINTMTPSTSVAYPSVTNTNIINGCDPSNPVTTEQISYQNSTATNYPNTLT